MVRTRLNIGCRYSTPVRERPLHPTRGHFTPEPSQTQAPVTPATEPERRAGGSLTTDSVRHGACPMPRIVRSRARGRATRCAPFLLCQPDSAAQTMTVVRNAG